MNPEHRKYIVDNVGKKSAKEIASHLGLKERKIKKFLEKNKDDLGRSKVGPSIITDRQTAFAAVKIPFVFTIFLIVVAGFLIYFNSFHNEFVFDDVFLITNNPIIKSFGNSTLAFKHGLFYSIGETTNNFYRPIQTFTYMVDYFLVILTRWGTI